MGKYEPLANFLRDEASDRWDAPFDEIEKILQFKLPPSARRHPSWWGNSHRGNHSQAKGWIPAGWVVRDVDLENEKVQLERARRGGAVEATTDLNELWRKARDISGITGRDELQRAAVTCFIQREAGRRLIEMGGTMPDFEPAPRKRPFG